jgi:hypothetical protein
VIAQLSNSLSFVYLSFISTVLINFNLLFSSLSQAVAAHCGSRAYGELNKQTQKHSLSLSPSSLSSDLFREGKKSENT